MAALPVTLDELTEIVRTCESIELDHCTPPYLQEFIASRLTSDYPTLAAKVRAFGQGEMEMVCQHIRRTFGLVR